MIKYDVTYHVNGGIKPLRPFKSFVPIRAGEYIYYKDSREYLVDNVENHGKEGLILNVVDPVGRNILL